MMETTHVEMLKNMRISWVVQVRRLEGLIRQITKRKPNALEIRRMA